MLQSSVAAGGAERVQEEVAKVDMQVPDLLRVPEEGCCFVVMTTAVLFKYAKIDTKILNPVLNLVSANIL